MNNRSKTTYIRSAKLGFDKTANTNKINSVALFLAEYRSAMVHYLDQYWDKHFADDLYCLDVDKLKPGSFYPSSLPAPDTQLSARTLKSAQYQVMAMINAALAKRAKSAWVYKKSQRMETPYANLKRKLDKQPLVKPTVPKNINAEINSINCQFTDNQSAAEHFDYWFELKSMFNRNWAKTHGFNQISLPLKSNQRFNKLVVAGRVMSSFLLSRDSIAVRVEITAVPSAGSEIVAIDQGITSLLSVAGSDGRRTTSTACPHGHSLTSIIHKLNAKKPGGRAFRRAQAHRTNYINWSVNQLDLTRVKEVRLEDVGDMGRGQHKSAFLSRFTYSAIEQSIRSKCELSGVRLILQPNEYRSQRCSACGFVHKNNRKGKSFVCRACGTAHDADVNAAENHLADLPAIDRSAICGLNRTQGFFWNTEFAGVYRPYLLNE